MSNEVNTNTGGGVGFLGLLFLVFLVLKLTGVIAWSWWWVTAPLWAGLALGLGLMAIMLIFCLISGLSYGVFLAFRSIFQACRD